VIDHLRDKGLGVDPVCRVLELSPSTYFARKKRPKSARRLRDEQLMPLIDQVERAIFQWVAWCNEELAFPSSWAPPRRGPVPARVSRAGAVERSPADIGGGTLVAESGSCDRTTDARQSGIRPCSLRLTYKWGRSIVSSQ
jgi:hypothetical protein